MSKFISSTRASGALMSVAMLCGRIEKRIRNYGTDVALPAAEIHIIKAIKEMEDIHVIGLANIFGVTKGAISQTLAKLEKKGLVEKEPHSANLSRLRLTLTPKGERAYARHEQIHSTFDSIVENQLSARPKEFADALVSFLRDVETELCRFDD